MTERRRLYTARLPVRWGDMDALGHVNNARYFTYFEQTRVDWLAEHPAVWTQDAGPVIAHAACSYKRPIVAPATVVVSLLAEAPRRSSIRTFYEVRTVEAPEVLFAVGEVVVVWIDYRTGRPISLPALFHDLWERATLAE